MGNSAGLKSAWVHRAAAVKSPWKPQVQAEWCLLPMYCCSAFEVYTCMPASFMSTMSLRVVVASHCGLTVVRETRAPE